MVDISRFDPAHAPIRLTLMFVVVAALLALMAAPAAGQGAAPQVPFLADWASSPHADAKAEAFVHWNKDGAIPKRCAKCHSDFGFRDFLGADGSKAGVIDHPAALGSVITCTTCHNEKTMTLASVRFPSGAKIRVTGRSDRCMLCHQGRASTASVNRAVKTLGPDQVSNKLRFINVHYRAAGATLLGTRVKGGYEYAGRNYQGRTRHDEAFNECAECHDPHSTEVRVAACTACHKEVENKVDLKRIRKKAADYDGDGDTDEGVAGEVETLHQALYAAIQTYGRTVAGTPIAYAAHRHPYFFRDTDGDGKAGKAEQTRKNAYNAFTPRLLKAAYNYQFVAKEPGAWAHNPAYTVQILHDSLMDLATKVKLDTARLKRP